MCVFCRGPDGMKELEQKVILLLSAVFAIGMTIRIIIRCNWLEILILTLLGLLYKYGGKVSWKAKRFTKHHMTPRQRYKQGIKTPWKEDSKENLLVLTEEKHKMLHKLFGNRTLEEIIAVLQRIVEMKGRK